MKKFHLLQRNISCCSIWGVDYDLGTNVVDVYVNYLRKKVDTKPDEKIIHTIIGMGYVLKESE